MTTQAILQQLYQKRIPVIRASSLDEALWISQQLLQAGFTCLELTLTIPEVASFFHAPRPPWMPQETVLGLGTLTSVFQVDTVLALPYPPDFVASPGLLDLESLHQAIKAFEEKGILYMAGVATPSELMQALSRGVQAMKWFPADALGGASTLKTMKAPFPTAKLIPFGGVLPSQEQAYLDAGAWAFGIGTCLMPRPEYLRDRNALGYLNDLYQLNE